jgi:hypothetical protein
MTAFAAALLLGAPIAGADTARAQGAPEEPPSRASRWLVPEAAADRVAGEVGASMLPGGYRWQDDAWLFVDLEVDHRSGFVTRSQFTTTLQDTRGVRRGIGALSLAYRWQGRVEFGLSGLLVSGSDNPRWAAGPGIYVGLGTPEGVRLTLSLGTAFGESSQREETRGMVLPFEFQLPIVVLPRLRVFFLHRGVHSSAPELINHRAEIHALIDDRWRVFAGVLLTFGRHSPDFLPILGVGGRFGR